MAAANTVKVTFLGDASSLARATTQARGEVDKFSKGIGGAKKIFAGFALAGGVAGAFSFAKGLIADAAESAKVMRLSENVIRSTGGAAKITAAQVSDLATSISNKTGVDDEAIQSGENLLLTFTNIRNGVGKGNDIFNQASQAITDMTAAMNDGNVTADGLKGSSIQLGKALNDPVKGITALTRVGVSFTQQQKDQIAAMVKSGDTMGAQKIILGELNKEFGGAAAAASTPAEKATVAWGNLREQLGSYLLPVVAKVATFLSGTVIPVISKFAENVHSGGGGFATFRNAISTVIEYIRGNVLPLLARFGAWFTSEGWPAIKRFAAAFWADLQPAIAAAANAFRTQIRPALENMIAKFREAWPTIQRVLVILGQVAGFILSRVVPVLIQLYARHLATTIRVLGQVFSMVVKVIGVLISIGAALGQAGAAFGRFVGKVSSAMASAYSAVRDGIGRAVDFIKGLPGKAVAAVGNLGSLLSNAGRDLIQGLLNGIKNAIPGLSSVLSGVTKLIPSWKGPASVDAKLLTPNGQMIIGGLVRGLESQFPAVQRSLQGLTYDLPAMTPGTLGIIQGPATGVRGPSVAAGAGRDSQDIRLILDVRAGEDDLKKLIRKWVRAEGGNVQKVLGQG